MSGNPFQSYGTSYGIILDSDTTESQTRDLLTVRHSLNSLNPLNSYMARITTGVSDVCPECGVAPHSVEHLFNCSGHPTQLTVQDLWDNPAAVADFLNLDS